jgi:antitoxin (DNA-binding transcriptional repressor) of toxin-antitoxin stability system
MIRATVHEVQTDLPRFLEQVAQGEVVEVIVKDQTVAELRGTLHRPNSPRPVGLAKGTFEVPASFFDPLPDELLRAFNGDSE